MEVRSTTHVWIALERHVHAHIHRAAQKKTPDHWLTWIKTLPVYTTTAGKAARWWPILKILSTTRRGNRMPIVNRSSNITPHFSTVAALPCEVYGTSLNPQWPYILSRRTNMLSAFIYGPHRIAISHTYVYHLNGLRN